MRQLPRSARPLLFLALTLAPALLASAAHAQMQVRIDTFGGRGQPVTLTLMQDPITAAECEANETIPLRVLNADVASGDTLFIAIWRGDAQSAQCATASNRSRMEPPCTRVFEQEITTAEKLFEIPVQDLFGSSCDETDTFFFWVLLVESRGDNTTDVPGTRSAVLEMAVDPTPPAAATNVMGRPGDATIELSWNRTTDGTIEGALAFVDLEGCSDDGEPMSTALMPGAAAPSTGGIALGSVDADSGSLNASTLPYDEWVAVAVSLVDRAGNASTLSNITCVQRVRIDGGLAEYCEARGMGGEMMDACLDDLECSVSAPGASGRARLVFFGMMAAALAFVTRRARRK